MSENKRKIPEHPFYSNPDAYGQNEKMPKVSEKTTEQCSVTSAKEWRKAQNIQGVTTDGTWVQFSTDVLDQLLEAYASSRLAEVTAQLECYAISQVSTAAEHIDWMQVQLNHSARNGPPCFYVESHPFGERFCLRAQQWQGHKKGEVHEFTSLAEMLKSATSSRVAGITAILKKACDRDWKDETPQQKQEHLRKGSAELREMFADEPADKFVHKIFELLDEIDQSYTNFEEGDKTHGQ